MTTFDDGFARCTAEEPASIAPTARGDLENIVDIVIARSESDEAIQPDQIRYEEWIASLRSQ